MCPPTTARSHLPCSGMGSCMRRRSSAFTAFSFVCNLLRIVCRNTVKRPLLLFFTQMCLKPRKLNVSGFPSPRHCRWSIAYGPNSSSRVFSVSSPKLLGIRFLLKAQHDIVREAHDDHVAMRSLLTPLLDPSIFAA